MEQDVATILEHEGFSVTTNRAFPDDLEPTSREIDVFAAQETPQDFPDQIQVHLELICECKNQALPFVFFTRKKNNRDKRRTPEEYVFPVNRYTQFVEDGAVSVPAFFHLGLDKFHYYYATESKAVQFCKIMKDGKKWKADQADVYGKTFVSTVKALNARKNEVIPKFASNHVWLWFPIVVVACELYCIDSSTVNPEPKEVSHVSFIRSLHSPHIQGEYLVEFVTLKVLPDFIRTDILSFFDQVVQLADKHPRELLDELAE